MKPFHHLITIDSAIMSGQAVFTGTRVPVESLFANLEKGISLSEFLDDFPTVSHDQAVAVLEIAGKIVSSAGLESRPN